MLNRILLCSWMTISLLLCKSSIAGELFSVIATGAPVNVSVTLCLNGQGPLSCQVYNVSASNLSILTTPANHTYSAAGIKINTPGFELINCPQTKNGYCLFSVSTMTPATINIYQTGTPYSVGGTTDNKWLGFANQWWRGFSCTC